jgi:hypothetical protein
MGKSHAHRSRTLVYRQSFTAMSRALSRASTSFVRERKLGPLQVMMTMQAAHCAGPDCGGQSWGDALTSTAASFGDNRAWAKRFAVSRVAFHKAVKKVNAEDQATLWEVCRDLFPSALGSTLVELHGKRFAHVDGTQVRVPHSDELIDAVGVQTNGPNSSSHYPTAKCVVALEAGTQRILGHELCRCKAVDKDQTPVLAREERDGWSRLRDKTLEDHAIIADCGFASHDDFADMSVSGKHFIIAVPKSWKLVRLFKARKQSDAVITIPLPSDPTRTLTVRVFTIKDGNGKTRYIASNLEHPFTLSDLRRLYKTRWSIEIWFRYAKEFLALRRLRSRTLHGVRLEMLAVLTLMQAVAAIRTSIAHHVNHITDLLCSLKEGYRKAKFSNALQTVRNLTHIVLTTPKAAEPPPIFEQLISQLVTYKPGRRYQRINHDPNGVFVPQRPSRSERKAAKKQGDMH